MKWVKYEYLIVFLTLATHMKEKASYLHHLKVYLVVQSFSFKHHLDLFGIQSFISEQSVC